MLKLRVVVSVQSVGVTSNISWNATEHLHGKMHQVTCLLHQTSSTVDGGWYNTQQMEF